MLPRTSYQRHDFHCHDRGKHAWLGDEEDRCSDVAAGSLRGSDLDQIAKLKIRCIKHRIANLATAFARFLSASCTPLLPE